MTTLNTVKSLFNFIVSFLFFIVISTSGSVHLLWGRKENSEVKEGKISKHTTAVGCWPMAAFHNWLGGKIEIFPSHFVESFGQALRTVVGPIN